MALIINTTIGNPPASGTVSISDNGLYDVASYASADVNVSGGGVTTRNVVVMDNVGGTFETVCYTDAYMVPQTASGAVSAAMPVGSLVVGYGMGEPPMVPMSQSGITQIAKFGTSRGYTYVYKVVE